MNSASSRYDYQFNPEDESSTAARICRLVGHGHTVLELGCAAGAMTAVLAQHYGCKVTGVEMNPKAAAEAARFAEHVYVASLENPEWAAPMATRRFDTVLAADVLEHLHNPAACLQQLHELLDENGRLIVSVPNIAHGGVIASLLCGEFTYRDVGLLDRTHVHFFTPASLVRMLCDNGFAVLEELSADTGAWHPEFADMWKRLPEPAQRWLERGPSSRAYQTIVVAQRVAGAARHPAGHADAHDAWLAELPGVFPDSAALEKAIQERACAHDELVRLRGQLEGLECQVQGMSGSLSWRVTAPLRAVARLLRRIRRG